MKCPSLFTLSVSLLRFVSMTTWRCAVGFQQIPGYMGSSVGQRNQKLLPHSTTTCVLSSNQTIQCPKRALKHNSSQVRWLAVVNQNIITLSFSHLKSQASKGTFIKVVFSVIPQTKMSALRRTVAVSMSVSTPLGATVVSAEVALCCMRTNTTVKKVFHLRFLSLCFGGICIAVLDLFLCNQNSH